MTSSISASWLMTCAAAALLTAAWRADAFIAQVGFTGEGSAMADVWAYPNRYPATPTLHVANSTAPFLQISNVPGADPRTQLSLQSDRVWHVQSTINAAGGDACDWHNLTPYVTPSSADASGSMNVSSSPDSSSSATFTVTWSASDPGVAFHIGWFLPNGAELFETPVMIGPFSRTDSYLITSPAGVDITNVVMECSAAAVSVPAPAGAALLGLGGLLVSRRRR